MPVPVVYRYPIKIPVGETLTAVGGLAGIIDNRSAGYRIFPGRAVAG